MKTSLACFLIMMFFSSMLVSNKKCNPYISQHIWINGRIVKIFESDVGFVNTNHRRLTIYFNGSCYVPDSVVYKLYK